MRLLQYDLAIEGHARQHVLLEEYHVVCLKAEILMTVEEIFSCLHRMLTRHNVPDNAICHSR